MTIQDRPRASESVSPNRRLAQSSMLMLQDGKFHDSWLVVKPWVRVRHCSRAGRPCAGEQRAAAVQRRDRDEDEQQGEGGTGAAG